MTATEKLRRLLDERGVEYRTSATGYIIDIGPNMTAYANRTDTTLDVSLRGLTPEQAVEATLWRGTCEVEGFDDGIDEGLDGEWFALAPATWFLSCDHEVYGSERPHYCPNCGARVIGGQDAND